jgi:hypothetical protein
MFADHERIFGVDNMNKLWVREAVIEKDYVVINVLKDHCDGFK